MMSLFSIYYCTLSRHSREGGGPGRSMDSRLQLSPPPLRGRARVGGVFEAIVTPCLRTTPAIYEITLPTRNVVCGHNCATSKSIVASFGGKRPSGRTLSISSACLKNSSLKLMADNIRSKPKKTPSGPIGWKNEVTGLSGSGTMRCLRTSKAWWRPSVPNFFHLDSPPTLTLPHEGGGKS